MNNFSNLLKNIDKIIIIIAVLLAGISILMIGSTQIATGFLSREVIVQIAAYFIGLIAICVMLRFNYTMFFGMEKYLYILSLVLLLLVYVPGLGVEQFGARSWINVGITTVQPSEIVKILYILILAGYLSENRDMLYNFKGLIKAGIVAGPIIVIVLKEDLGSALVFAAIWVVMVFFAGIDLKVFAKFFALVLAAVPVAYVFMADYQKERIEAFLHPDNLELSGNWQVWQSKVAIGSGGITGKGLFNGTQKELDFIPVQTSDFIFSVIGEELGLIGGLIVIGLFAILLIRMASIVRDALDFYGALVVVGVIGMFTFQIFENIAMTMGLMPVTGITLPFLSSGGSSIISNMLALGLVLDVGMRSKGINF
ncbi:FtsW/RodA/SpoVE family cell cycle protein [Ihubacter sp. rT4E-8]|uniref:FtsW/RodA/SpoVE family cell cycle protein n=1 Tax=unclassified Ihubacter TaxID=2633299 RepID=UPI003C7E72B6